MTAAVFWFTGLSGAGKSSIAAIARASLESDGLRVLILDGDDVRARRHRRLGFDAAGIEENNRLIADLCAERRADADIILVPVISPFRRSRAAARMRLSPGFYEIYVKADVATVVARDPKGLYGKAARGEIGGMIGVSPGAVPYEPPVAADLVIDTDRATAEEAAAALCRFVRARLSEFTAPPCSTTRSAVPPG